MKGPSQPPPPFSIAINKYLNKDDEGQRSKNHGKLATISITTNTSFGIDFTILDMGNQYNLIHEYLG